MNLAGLAFVPQGMQDFQTRATKLAQAQLDLDNEKRSLQAQSGAAAGWLTPDGQAAAPSRAAQPAQGIAGGSAGPAPAAAQPGPPGVSQYAGQPGQQPGQPQFINGVPVNPGAIPGSAGSSMTGSDAPSLRPVDPGMTQQGGQGGSGMGFGPQAAGGQPGVPPGAQQPPGAAGGAPQFNSPDPQQTLRAIATRIKQANPKMDNATLFQAVTQTVGLMGKFVPEQRLQLQAELQIANINQRADAAIQRAQSAQQVAEIRAESARQIADMRAEVARRGQDVTARGQDVRAETSQRGQDLAHGDRAAGLAVKIDQYKGRGAPANQADKLEYKTMMAERMRVSDEIQQLNAQGKVGGKDYAELNKRKQAIDDRLVKFWQTRKDSLPPPSDLLKDTGTPAAAGDQAGKEIPLASAGTAEGPTATDDKGNKVKWDGKAWVPVQ